MHKLIIVIFTFLNLNFIFALEKIDALFVSNISFSVTNEKVLISWKNPDNFKDFITIYRYDTEIDSEEILLKSEKIVLLTNREEKYIDIPGTGNFFYAIIVTNKENKKDNIVLVPFRNYNITPAVVEKQEILVIKNFSSLSNKYSITLQWDWYADNSVDKNINVNLYRNTEPILNIESLKKSIKIANVKVDSKYYIDIPVAKIGYFYAILKENEENITLIENVNTTINPVFVEINSSLMESFSLENFIPLPLLSFEKDPKSGINFSDSQILKKPKKNSYSNSTKNIIDKYKIDNLYNKFLKEKDNSFKDLDFILLKDEEIFSPKEYYNEYNKIISLLKNREYEQAGFFIEQFMTEILPKDLLTRCSFYLGEIYYLKKNYNFAYIQFVYCFSEFKKEVSPFLQSINVKLFENLQ